MKNTLSILFLLVCSISAYSQARIHVDSTATGANDGSSWANAYTKLQDGLANSSSGDTILVSKGTYYPDEGAGFTNNNRDSSFRMRDSVVMLGGFCTATGDTTLATRNWENNSTILNGDIDQNNTFSGNSYHVITSSGLDSVAVLDGFTITGGNADGSGSGPNRSNGGGMLNIASSPTITNASFMNNSATGGSGGSGGSGSGGGMYNSNSSPTITNASFSNNSATSFGSFSSSFGGGMYNANSSPTITNASFSNNSATGDSGGSGGGMYNLNSSPTITNASFSNNSATSFGSFSSSFGGGMYNANSSPTITNASFSNNSATGGSGGGMSNSNSSPTITNASFSGNKADNFGGGMYNVNSSPTITNASFSGNKADGFGGGMTNAGNSSFPIISNSIIWNNCENSQTNTTTASIRNFSTSSPRISYSLIANSINGSGNWRNAIGDSIANNKDTDPLFIMDVSDVCGTTPTGGNLRLQASSPAINMGSNDSIMATGVMVDLDSMPRILQGIVDMGAYERLNCDDVIVLYVDSSNTAGTQDGLSWATAFSDLQDALNYACEVDSILVAQGTYYPDGTNNGGGTGARDTSFDLRDSVVVLGGYPTGGGTRDWIAHPTTLSGDIGTPNDSTDNSYHVVTSTGLDSVAVLDGFTITGGNADGSGSGPNRSNGGGMLNIASSPTISNANFINNTATGRSGGPFGGSGSGGGMYNSNSSPTITNASFSNNSATGGSSGDFGGSGSGGGMSNSNSSPTITNASFMNNSATGGSGDFGGSGLGGGMYNFQSSPTITNASFMNNSATGGSGDFGGSGSGGGMENSNSSPTITNASFSGNKADDFGGGMTNSGSLGSFPIISNSIIWNNCENDQTDMTSASIRNFSTSRPRISYSLIANSIDANGMWETAIGDSIANNKDTDPLFVMDVSDVCNTPTGGDLRLQAASPAINMGSNDSIMATGVMVDLDSMPRILQGIVDMGAYEQKGCVDAMVIYVDSAATGLCTGLSWADAFPSLQDALNYDCEVDSILVSKGTYYPDEGAGFTDNARDSSFRLRDSVVMLGGYPSGGGIRDVENNLSILSGDIGVPSDSIDNSYHVVTSTGLDSVAVLDGFIITGGNADGSGSGVNRSNGGGMLNIASSPRIAHCRFQNNSAQGSDGIGGGFGSGGGMYNTNSSSPRIAYCSFQNNSAQGGDGEGGLGGDGGGGSGGGMFNTNSSSPRISNCTFINNSAQGGNGNGDSDGNGGTGGSGAGGGMFNDQSSPTITNCTFMNNSAQGGNGNERNGGGGVGGGLYNFISSPSITNCTFINNSAQGGISISGLDGLGQGGGMYNSNSSPNIVNVSISGNIAGENGGGMFNGNSSPTISNSIIWNNCENSRTDTTSASIFNSISSSPRISYSLIANSGGSGSWDSDIGTDDGNNKDTDPLFIMDVTDVCGTPTGGDLRLQAASPAINMGSNDSIPNGINTDLDGEPRIQQDIVDMGAYEQPGVASLRINVLLSGPLGINPADAIMWDSLRSKGFIPLTSPYGTGEMISDSASILADNGDNSVVDWVLIELRNQFDPAIVVASRSALLQSDGVVVDTNGLEFIRFDTAGTGGQDSFYIAVNHRNHLGAMTDVVYALEASLVDLTNTSEQFYSQGFAPQDSLAAINKFALWPGNANQDSQVDRDDEQAVVRSKVVSDTDNTFMLLNYIRMGYCPEDVNMDGSVIYAGQSNDIDVLMDAIYRHPQNGAQDPGFVIPEQLPSP